MQPVDISFQSAASSSSLSSLSPSSSSESSPSLLPIYFLFPDWLIGRVNDTKQSPKKERPGQFLVHPCSGRSSEGTWGVIIYHPCPLNDTLPSCGERQAQPHDFRSNHMSCFPALHQLEQVSLQPSRPILSLLHAAACLLLLVTGPAVDGGWLVVG